MALGTSMLLAFAALATPPKPPPNIVFFLVGDMGWQDTSVPFHSADTPLNRRYHTPNMERLAREGMLFTNAYAAPVCSPSRVSLMTGANASRHHVYNWTLWKDRDTSAEYHGLLPPRWNVNGISLDSSTPRSYHAATLAQTLRGQGYRTILVGKSHLGAVGTPGADPKNLGFEVNIGGHAAGGPGSYLPEHHFSATWRGGDAVWDIPNLESYYDTNTFLTDALTIEANKAVDQAVDRNQPFFLYLSHYAVHVPFEPDSRFVGKYKVAGLDPQEAMYAALIEGMDDSLGKVLRHLESRGVRDNTIVVFMSDNGGLTTAGRGDKLFTHNLPLRCGKGSAYEGGIRVPLIVSWPKVTRSGSRCSVPVIIDDWFPTIASMAGVRPSPELRRGWDGRDLTPLLREKGRFPKDRPLVWHYPTFWGVTGPGIEPFSALRSGPWKLIYTYADRRSQLYNLDVDIGEDHDLALVDPARAAAMTRTLGRLLRRNGAMTPVDKASGRPLPLPGEGPQSRPSR